MPRPISLGGRSWGRTGLFCDGALAVTLSITGSVPGYWATEADVPGPVALHPRHGDCVSAAGGWAAWRCGKPWRS
ncbi:MAG: hypothetical protein M5U09_23000 [Gammaproteobacteria bacterium]|nr:hypothetical protein [Gammaproteobacteria bacterium]